jgi:uncharacterized phage-like protein YoqJ
VLKLSYFFEIGIADENEEKFDLLKEKFLKNLMNLLLNFE